MALNVLNLSVLYPSRWVIKPILQKLQLKKIHTEIPTKEIQIPVKWGHVAAKLWGSENERPILALHGWLDNAGTWDTLAPSLCKKRPILAIDFPGHGLSSWIPEGMQYYTWNLPLIILYIKEYFKWEKVSLLGHSMGSVAALRFASIFPDDVDFFIAFENLIYDYYNVNRLIAYYTRILTKIQATLEVKTEPPCYTMDEMIKSWHMGTDKSVAMDNVIHLLKRGANPSSREPNKYNFSRDPRLKSKLISVEDKNFIEGLVRRLKCPTLYFKAIYSSYSISNFSVNVRKIIAGNNNEFEFHFIPGTHHVHLNDPEKVEPLILNFLQKHKFIIK